MGRCCCFFQRENRRDGGAFGVETTGDRNKKVFPHLFPQLRVSHVEQRKRGIPRLSPSGIPHVYSIIAHSDVSYVDSGAGQWLIAAHFSSVVATLSGEIFGKFHRAIAAVGQYEGALSCKPLLKTIWNCNFHL